jgi:hypothetical protein
MYDLTLGFGTKNPTQIAKFNALQIKTILKFGHRPIYAFYRPVRVTCPSSCVLMETDRAPALREEDGGAGYRQAIIDAFSQRSDLSSWLYTHAWREAEVREWRDNLPSNVGCVASLNSTDEIAEAVSLGWKCLAVVTATADGKGFTPEEAKQTRAAIREVAPDASPLPCPAQRPELSMGCADCMKCMRTDTGKVTVVVFAAHGAQKKKAGCATGGCYAQNGPVNWQQKKSLERHMDFREWVMTRPYYSLVRLSVSGDVWTDDDDRKPVCSPAATRSLQVLN